MSVLARISFTLAGLALAVPSLAQAQSTPPPAQAKPGLHKHKKSLFGREHVCPECQRAAVKAKYGVDVPPPPALAMHSQHLPGAGDCTVCGNQAVMASASSAVQVMPAAAPAPAPPMVASNDPMGRASVGGEGGGDPTPVGMVSPSIASYAPRSAVAPHARDSAVAQSSYSPSAPRPAGANRPHVISHLFGISAIGRDAREAFARKSEDKHASIPYGVQSSTVDELPARMVYGRNGH